MLCAPTAQLARQFVAGAAALLLLMGGGCGPEVLSQEVLHQVSWQDLDTVLSEIE